MICRAASPTDSHFGRRGRETDEAVSDYPTLSRDHRYDARGKAVRIHGIAPEIMGLRDTGLDPGWRRDANAIKAGALSLSGKPAIHPDPARVVAFNTSEGWSQDVSTDIAQELRRPIKSGDGKK